MKKLNGITRQKPLLFGCFLTIVVILWNCRKIGMCHQPTIFQDELGYWTNAAVFAGKDWSGVSGNLVWYSYGYSFLLAVILRVLNDPTMQYQAALVLNAVMLGAVFWIFRQILRQLFHEMNPYLSFVLAFVGVMYTPYQIYTLTTWAEIAVLLVVSLITLLLFRALEKPDFLKLGALGALCAYSYMIHNRCIGIVAAVCFTLLLAMLFRKIPIRYVLGFAAVFGLGMGVHVLIKGWLTQQIWDAGPPAANDAGTVMSRLKAAVSSSQGIRLWLSLILSQGFAGIVSGFCFPMVAFISITSELTQDCMQKVKHRKAEFCSAEFLQKTYLLCAFAAMLLISSIFMLQYDRIDQVIYSRYIDCTLGLMTAYGIAAAIKKRRNIPMLLLVLPVVLFIGAQRAGVLTARLETQLFNNLCTPVNAVFYYPYRMDFYTYAFLGSVPVLLAAGLCLLLRRHKRLKTVLISGMLTVLFIRCNAVGTDQLRRSQLAQDVHSGLLAALSDVPEDRIYVKADTGAFRNLAQMRLQNKQVIAVDDINEVPAEGYFLCRAEDGSAYSQYWMQEASESYLVLRNMPKDSLSPSS